MPPPNFSFWRLSPLQDSDIKILSVLYFLDFQVHLLNSGSPPGSCWVPSHFTVVWKSSKVFAEPIIGLTLFVFQLSGITVLCCLLSCVLKTSVLYTLSIFYCFGRRKMHSLLLHLGWKHKFPFV